MEVGILLVPCTCAKRGWAQRYLLSNIFSNFFNDIENRNFQFSKRNIVRENPLAKLVENISGQFQEASPTWFELKILV